MKKEKKERRKPSLGMAVMWRAVAFVMGAWLICMCCLTAMVARSTYLDYVNQVNAYVQQDGLFDYDLEKSQLDNQSAMIVGILSFSPQTPEMELPICLSNQTLTRDFSLLFSDLPDQVGFDTEQWSVTIYDNTEQLIMGENNHVYLTYRDYYKCWDTSSEDYVCGYTYIDLDRTECGRAMIEEWKNMQGFSDSLWLNAVNPRFTGYFDGDEFVLLNVEVEINNNRLQQNWHCIYDGEKIDHEDVVVIYPAEMCLDRCDVQVTVKDRQWKLEDVGMNMARHSAANKYQVDEIDKILSWGTPADKRILELWNSNSLFESVITRVGGYLDENGELCDYVAVLRVQPVRVAMAMLADVYILTFIPLALILLFFCRRIRRELMDPLGHILRYPNMDPLYRMTPKYREPVGLLKIFNQAQQDIHELKTENTRLATALDYAHNAEENRRRMVSNITHELKTPLAVIHSYAEGLKEGIAVDKQEHYLNVILEESERMDAMVLEMLDLSRLEAGKVRLASDRFSLLELTRRVVDKMSLLVEEKELKVEYVWAHDCEITADEGRVSQAVTNLVSNAIKYSPRGAAVYISVTKTKENVMFAIENQSEPLSDDALGKVWDSFYQADASHTEQGTGLGLPITKAIIELHGGTCHVTNTSTGVEFKFYLP